MKDAQYWTRARRRKAQQALQRVWKTRDLPYWTVADYQDALRIFAHMPEEYLQRNAASFVDGYDSESRQ